MWDIILTVLGNLGTTPEVVITFIMCLGSLIFFAVDFQKGLVSNFIISIGVFVWFYAQGLNYKYPIVIFLITLVLMALSLYSIQKQRLAGGQIV